MLKMPLLHDEAAAVITTKLMIPRRRDADPVEHHDERALRGVELVPGDERHDDDQGADVEDQDPPHHGVDRAREHRLDSAPRQRSRSTSSTPRKANATIVN